MIILYKWERICIIYSNLLNFSILSQILKRSIPCFIEYIDFIEFFCEQKPCRYIIDLVNKLGKTWTILPESLLPQITFAPNHFLIKNFLINTKASHKTSSLS